MSITGKISPHSVSRCIKATHYNAPSGTPQFLCRNCGVPDGVYYI